MQKELLWGAKVADPISNPGIPPTQATPPLPGGKPSLSEDAEGQRPFTMPDPLAQPNQQVGDSRPSPMDMMKDQKDSSHWAPEEMKSRLQEMHNQLQNTSNKLHTPSVREKLTSVHEEGLKKVTDKMNPDMRKIATTTEQEYNPPALGKGEGLLNHIGKWIDGAQGTLSNAMGFLQSNPKIGTADYLKLQYSVQRASQRAELLASILGASTSGVKAIMSTQLG